MIDLHCHILPGVDDGPQSLDESLCMARFCADDGITTITATPHCHRHIHLLRDDILPRVAAFNQQLTQAGIPLKILPGSEIKATDSTEYRREFEQGVYCHLGDGKDFTLLEFSWSFDEFPDDSVELVQWIRNQQMIPIIAHPERHPYFADEPARLSALVDVGAWVQITVDSLLGNHGRDPQIYGERYLKEIHEAILASDAHNMKRCSGLSAGFAWVREHLGEQRADDLLSRANHVEETLLTMI
jgi:protein-tyrosine phosphatase